MGAGQPTLLPHLTWIDLRLFGAGHSHPNRPVLSATMLCLHNDGCACCACPRSGHESKIFKNATSTPSKRSSVERTVDKIIMFMFGLLFCMCITGCVYYGFWTGRDLADAWYLGPWDRDAQYDPDRPALAGVTNFVTVFILYGEWGRGGRVAGWRPA